MIKPIKFDLKLNNGEITLARLDDIKENLSPALFEHFHSGKLAKWLRVRKLEEFADKMEALRNQNIADKNELDVKLFKNLCEIFVSEVSEEDARKAMQNYQPTTFEQNSNDEEVELFKDENQLLKAEIEQLKNQLFEKDSKQQNISEKNIQTNPMSFGNQFGWQNESEWKKIKEGMLENQVMLILGEPHRVKSGERITEDRSRTYYFYEGKDLNSQTIRGTIDFIHGKVSKIKYQIFGYF